MFYLSTVFIHIFAIRFTHRRPCSRENSVRWTVGSYLLCLMFFSLERKHSHNKEDGNSLRKISNQFCTSGTHDPDRCMHFGNRNFDLSFRNSSFLTGGRAWSYALIWLFTDNFFAFSVSVKRIQIFYNPLFCYNHFCYYHHYLFSNK